MINMDFDLRIKIARLIGFSIGMLDGIMLNEIPESLKAKIPHVQDYIKNEFDKIIEGLEDVRNSNN